MKLIALCRLDIGGAIVERGGEFDADEDNAVRLVRRGHAEPVKAQPKRKRKAGKVPDVEALEADG